MKFEFLVFVPETEVVVENQVLGKEFWAARQCSPRHRIAFRPPGIEPGTI